MTTLDVLIIGAGFSGLGMAARLQREGRRSWLLLEKSDGVGGTWRENRYPGCACDVPSHLYSFSFSLNAEWSHHFAAQPEILAYLERVAADEGLLPRCRFNVEVSSCDYDESTATWTVTTAAGETHRAKHLVLGVGGLHHPKFPEVEGRERFTGPQLHSAKWDTSLDLTGKRVALVGTGASAIQVLPEIAKVAKQVTVLQRTPAWVIARHDKPISRAAKSLFRVFPGLLWLNRARIYAWLESRVGAFTRTPKLLRVAEWLGRRNLSRVRDEATRRALTPTYAAGCKRVLLSDDYYPAFNRENVKLEVGGVKAVTSNGVVTSDGRELACDVIAWCTGFEVAAPLAKLRVVGRGGRELARDAWKDGVHAYRGTTVPGFPNLFMLVGPNTGLGHNSMVYMIESQLEFVLQHLDLMDASGARAVEPTEEATRAYNAMLQARFPGTIWASGCASWYLDETGHNRTLWPGATFSFRALTSKVEPLHVKLERREVGHVAVAAVA